jgi:hypothetical protein
MISKDTFSSNPSVSSRSETLARFERELVSDRELVAAILTVLPPTPERGQVRIRTDRASVDMAICKALALAVMGTHARVGLTTQ